MSGATRFADLPLVQTWVDRAASNAVTAAQDVAADIGCQPSRGSQGVNSRPGSRMLASAGLRQGPRYPVAAGVERRHYRVGRAPGCREWPWLQATRHRRPEPPSANASPRAKATPTRMPAKEPGPTVTPIRSIAARSDARGIEHGLQDRGELLGMAATNRGAFFRKNMVIAVSRMDSDGAMDGRTVDCECEHVGSPPSPARHRA
jgi:hypothetical protein